MRIMLQNSSTDLKCITLATQHVPIVETKLARKAQAGMGPIDGVEFLGESDNICIFDLDGSTENELFHSTRN